MIEVANVHPEYIPHAFGDAVDERVGSRANSPAASPREASPSGSVHSDKIGIGIFV